MKRIISLFALAVFSASAFAVNLTVPGGTGADKDDISHDVKFPSGKTLDVSAGTLTLGNDKVPESAVDGLTEALAAKETPAAAQAKADAAQNAAIANTAEVIGVNGNLGSDQKQRFAVSASTWTTILTATGEGEITKLWIAVHRLSGSADMRGSKIRITFNGAGTPQFGGSSGIPLELVFGTALQDTTFRTEVIGVTRNESGMYSGYLAFPMPFTSGAVVELFTPESTWIWLMPEVSSAKIKRGSLNADEDWVLHASEFDATVAAEAEQTILSASGPVQLLGLWHYLSPESPPKNFYYLEGDYRIFYDGAGAASYRASGAEDFYGSSYYFDEGVFARNDAGLVVRDSTNHRVSMYRFWPISDMPRSNSMVMTWTNGDSDYAGFEVDYSTVSRGSVFFYVKE